MTNSISDAKSRNQQLTDYLKFYINMKTSPGYAVLLNGEWGSGKTWLINKFRAENTGQKFVYVSLYGISSIAEIETQFFQQLHPFLSSKVATIGTKLITGVLKGTLHLELNGDKNSDVSANIQIPKLDIQKFLSDAENCVLIFDDLERCPDLHKVLGYINHFVEHQGQKVILVGYQNQIPDLSEYQKKNEKLIGRTFTISTEIEDALSVFLKESAEEVQVVLIENLKLILKIYERCGHGNLRTLKYSIIEYERFYLQLPQKAREHKGFQSSCISAFFSLCIELRSGQITTQDIKTLSDDYQSHQVKKALSKEKEPEVAPVILAFERHFDGNKEISPNEESLFFFFEHGFIPEPVIQDAILGNSFFIENETPTWVKLWHFYDLTDDEFDTHLREVLTDFKNFKYTIQGELRHVAGIIISLSKNGLIALSYDEAVSLIDGVVQHMIENNMIEPLPFEQEKFPRFDDVYVGLQFSEYKDECCKRISIALKKYQELKKADHIKSTVPDLLAIMKTDSGKLFRMLTVGSSEGFSFYKTPVLQYIPVDKFLDTYLGMSPANHQRFNIGYIFKERYGLVNSFPELEQELGWLKELLSLMDTAAPGLPQLTRFQLKRMRDDYLVPAITLLENWQNAKSNAEQKGT